MVPVEHLIQPKGVVFEVRNLGGELTQWYYQNGNTWEPTRKGTASTVAQPLTLKPVLSLIHPETGEKVTPSYTCYWYTSDSPDPITNTTDDANANYVLMDSGRQLMIKRDVMPNAPVRVELHLEYAEPESGKLHKLHWADTLTANFKADTTYSLHWVSEPRQVYNPVGGGSSNKTFQMKAILGDVDVTSNVKFFWYWVNGSGTEVAIDQHLAYVSGQGTATLVVDALKAQYLAIHCKIGKTTSAVSPTEPVVAKASVRWRLPQLRGHADTPNGLARRQSEKTKEFQLAVQAGGRAGMVPDAVRKANFLTRWEKQENGVVTTVAYGDNPGIDVSSIQSAVIRPVPSLLGPDEAVIADDGVAIIADDGVAVTERS